MSVLTRRQQVYHATIQQQDNAGLAYASNKKKSPPIKDKAATTLLILLLEASLRLMICDAIFAAHQTRLLDLQIFFCVPRWAHREIV